MTRGERAIEAIESHFAEVYSGEVEGPHRPNFIWDVEMYQAIDLLPEDFKIPHENELSGSVYAMKKRLDTALEKLAAYAAMPRTAVLDNQETEAFIAETRDEINAHTNKFVQLCIAFGKHLSGFKPGSEGWTDLDNQAMMWALETTEEIDAQL